MYKYSVKWVEFVRDEEGFDTVNSATEHWECQTEEIFYKRLENFCKDYPEVIINKYTREKINGKTN